MSATVAAALKKIAVAILTDKKLRKAVLGIVLGIIIIVIMPVVAVIALFNGDINIDTDRLQQIVVEEMSDEEKAKLQAVEDTIFQSTRPVRGGTSANYKHQSIEYISIHPPRAGRDYRECGLYEAVLDFNPPAPCGAGQQ